MCGRSRSALAPERVSSTTRVPEQRWRDRDKYRPTYNLSPGHYGVVVKHNHDDHQPELQTMKWGLVPSFTKPTDKPDHWKMFNARSETVDSKPVFSRLLSRKRCVVLFEGFYEWAKEGGKKQPYYLHLHGGGPMRMAGLYDSYLDSEGQQQYSFTVLTVDSCKRLAWLHDRMPALLPSEEAVQAWLDDSSTAEPGKLVAQLCTPYDGEDLVWHPVTPAMSKPSFDGPECSQDMRKRKGAISAFFKPVASKAGKAGEAAGKAGTAAGAAKSSGAAADAKAVAQQGRAAGGGQEQGVQQGRGAPGAGQCKPVQGSGVAAGTAVDAGTEEGQEVAAAAAASAAQSTGASRNADECPAADVVKQEEEAGAGGHHAGHKRCAGVAQLEEQQHEGGGSTGHQQAHKQRKH